MRIVTLLFILGITTIITKGQGLEEQFKELRDNAETFKVYKVIKQTELNSFWNTVTDSINIIENKLAEARHSIEVQQRNITEKEAVITAKNQEIEGLEFAATHISVLGINMFKEAFIIISFTVITLIIIMLVLLYGRFKTSTVVSRKKIHEFNKLNAEYEEHKKEALEKQMKLRRELQTQINKLEEIRST
ncbi:hypothetical protein FNH22_21630 [Fulvivirga sp. M361]|uniref:hypothetical protein n=1 Tax=Fulvivirga sp. M361 TaxID=2594266 RepID=UPI001179C63A|nr:hypothetical protein [Fulvivirga sp. M361]TRX52654.1 hypothetical protein FNH22_21630 [Fulvivirga sp. M361]